ncbi:hypothetical protein [Amycolatopsis sp. Hca4]|uniref:hypothetical protein n=1 Tax=Amycolatopsis sp. Hca4 TaxID=2742131 RepID=UPI00159155B4|nr:hypothetical protein [Amycolatopsis sp. Hca4]QKV74363.1 hypothetical protein HUT10_11735 [Amycolatopsis sp. Hca4]
MNQFNSVLEATFGVEAVEPAGLQVDQLDGWSVEVASAPGTCYCRGEHPVKASVCRIEQPVMASVCRVEQPVMGSICRVDRPARPTICRAEQPVPAAG